MRAAKGPQRTSIRILSTPRASGGGSISLHPLGEEGHLPCLVSLLQSSCHSEETPRKPLNGGWWGPCSAGASSSQESETCLWCARTTAKALEDEQCVHLLWGLGLGVPVQNLAGRCACSCFLTGCHSQGCQLPRTCWESKFLLLICLELCSPRYDWL